MHKLADLRTSRTLRNSLVVPRNLDYREHGALSGSRKASEVSRETGFFHGEIQPAFLLHITCKVSGWWREPAGIEHLRQAGQL